MAQPAGMLTLLQLTTPHPQQDGHLWYVHLSVPQPFWHKGLVSWKIIFPQIRVGKWFQDDSRVVQFIMPPLIWQEAELRWLCEGDRLLNTDKASLAHLTLTSCCEAQFTQPRTSTGPWPRGWEPLVYPTKSFPQLPTSELTLDSFWKFSVRVLSPASTLKLPNLHW